MPQKYDHVVWDWNGTLLNDAALCVTVMNELLARRRLPPITTDFYRALIEFPVIRYYEKLGFDFSREPFETISGEYVALYQAGWRSCRLQDGAIEALEGLKAAGVGQSMLSASKSGYLVEQIEYFAIIRYFDLVTGAETHHGYGKVDLAPGHVRSLGCDPKRVLFVGDMPHDAEAAREAGSSCLLLSRGHCNAQRLAPMGFPIVDGMRGVLAHVLGV